MQDHMKNRIKQSFAVPVLLAVLGSVLGGHLPAQTFTTLHSFTATDASGTTTLAAPVAWTAVSAAPGIVNEVHTVTNPISGTQLFYRLSQ
jgi:hypothetical protein